MYGRAFDILKLSDAVDLDDLDECEKKLGSLTICEIKATKKNLPASFSGFFFALTAAEILVAQSLKEQFRFVLVNTKTCAHLEARLGEILGRAKGIYPTWSICL